MKKLIITAKFRSTCSETGRKIQKGEFMLYNYVTKQCYCVESNEYASFQAGNKREFAGNTGSMEQVTGEGLKDCFAAIFWINRLN